jgi:cobalamin biosynthesis Mg chelatase CobN
LAKKPRDPLHDTAALRALSGNEDVMNDTSMGVPQDEALLEAGLSGAIAQQAQHVAGKGAEEPDTDWVRRQERSGKRSASADSSSGGLSAQPSPSSKASSDASSTSSGSGVKAVRAANQARAANLNRKQAQAAGMQFRKTAIPLLLIMAVALLGMGAYMMHRLGEADEIDKAENALLRHGNLFVGIAFVLGICLLAGAGYFQYEVFANKRKQKKQESNGS